MSEKRKPTQQFTITEAGDIILEDMAADLIAREKRRLDMLIEQHQMGVISRVECLRFMLALPR